MFSIQIIEIFNGSIKPTYTFRQIFSKILHSFIIEFKVFNFRVRVVHIYISE